MATGTGVPGPVHAIEALAMPVPSALPMIWTLQSVLNSLLVRTRGVMVLLLLHSRLLVSVHG